MISNFVAPFLPANHMQRLFHLKNGVCVCVCGRVRAHVRVRGLIGFFLEKSYYEYYQFSYTAIKSLIFVAQAYGTSEINEIQFHCESLVPVCTETSELW
jgi:hypothetical protein